MRDRPTGADLLAIARETLRRELLPKLPEESRYAALMVANAIAIAAREAEYGDGPEREELARLAALLGETGDAGQRLREELARLNRELVRRIRQGAFPAGAPASEALRRHLFACARQQVGVSNPKYLERPREKL